MKETTSAFDFIIDLSPSSKIRSQFSDEEWAELVNRGPKEAQKSYHHEIEPLISHLFSEKMNLSQARKKWYDIRNLASPEYNNEFSYKENDWEKIKLWVEQITGRLYLEGIRIMPKSTSK
ncbi:15050_t:CDS:2 [Acaulospora colombiana]|uniref:15050_t:CDS:1 n=1 Tax=Acaulospora colombiana TaxID=27376 RepID=A0ACA9MKI0_9GLOM|nr:15050_t:CDS:2 [Acaulospora colombiana]